jgi:L-methionine (R)-S-oxide reductase
VTAPAALYDLRERLAERARASKDRDALARVAVDALRRALPRASWVGVYWLAGDALVLGPYAGPPTEHVRIPVGRGVCGAAIAQDRDQVVDDVTTRPEYLACSPTVRSEIVVLVRCDGRVVGQLDLDSEHPAAFSPADHALLRGAADLLGAALA